MYIFKNLPELTLTITRMSAFTSVLAHSDCKFY